MSANAVSLEPLGARGPQHFVAKGFGYLLCTYCGVGRSRLKLVKLLCGSHQPEFLSHCHELPDCAPSIGYTRFTCHDALWFLRSSVAWLCWLYRYHLCPAHYETLNWPRKSWLQPMRFCCCIMWCSEGWKSSGERWISEDELNHWRRLWSNNPLRSGDVIVSSRWSCRAHKKCISLSMSRK